MYYMMLSVGTINSLEDFSIVLKLSKIYEKEEFLFQ